MGIVGRYDAGAEEVAHHQNSMHSPATPSMRTSHPSSVYDV